MPIYMDIHTVPGVKARDVAEAHRKDVFFEHEHACKCMTYWVDEVRENVFCLIEAPNKEAVSELHGRAHGLYPGKIIEVSSGIVESFLGRIYDPEEAEITKEGLKVFHDPSFRVLLITKIIDPILLEHQLGVNAVAEILNRQNSIIRKNISFHDGREVEHEGVGFIASFEKASKAVNCALDIQKELPETDAKTLGFRIGINAGEPVSASDKLFGDTIQLANHICNIAKTSRVALTSSVKTLVSKDLASYRENIFSILSVQDENTLESILKTLEENWQNEAFGVNDFCQAMAMSKSHLYRTTTDFFNLSPNLLIKEFRLEKAKELLKKQRYSISQITFESGFTSPSYFTKCFKKKYGLLPMEYLDLIH